MYITSFHFLMPLLFWTSMAIKWPWDGWLAIATPTISALILANTLAVFLLAVLTSTTTHFSATDNSGPAVGLQYLSQNLMGLRATLLFYYLTVPIVMSIESTASLLCLWSDKLRPSYAISSAVFSVIVWATQFALWSLCLFPSTPGSAAAFCPVMYRETTFKIFSIQYVGTTKMALFAIPSLFILQAIYLAFAIAAWRRERQPSENTRNDEEARTLVTAFRNPGGGDEIKPTNRVESDDTLIASTDGRETKIKWQGY